MCYEYANLFRMAIDSISISASSNVTATAHTISLSIYLSGYLAGASTCLAHNCQWNQFDNGKKSRSLGEKMSNTQQQSVHYPIFKVKIAQFPSSNHFIYTKHSICWMLSLLFSYFSSLSLWRSVFLCIILYIFQRFNNWLYVNFHLFFSPIQSVLISSYHNRKSQNYHGENTAQIKRSQSTSNDRMKFHCIWITMKGKVENKNNNKNRRGKKKRNTRVYHGKRKQFRR